MEYEIEFRSLVFPGYFNADLTIKTDIKKDTEKDKNPNLKISKSLLI